MQLHVLARSTTRVRRLLLMLLLAGTVLAAAAPRAAAHPGQQPAAPPAIQPAQTAAVAGRITYLPLALDPVRVTPKATVWIRPTAANINPTSYFAVRVFAKNSSSVADPFVSTLVTWNTAYATFQSSEAGPGDFVATQRNGVQVQFTRPLAPGQERVVTLVLRARPGVTNVDVQFGGDFSGAGNQSGYLNKINVFIGARTPPPRPPSARFACNDQMSGTGQLGINPGNGTNPFGTAYTFGAFRTEAGGCGDTFAPFARVRWQVRQPTGPTRQLGQYSNADTYGQVQLGFNDRSLLTLCPVNLCAFAMSGVANIELTARFNSTRPARSSQDVPASVAAQSAVDAAADTGAAAFGAAQQTDAPADYGAEGGIVGIVTNAAGDPLEGVFVGVLDPDTDDFIDGTFTDADGLYIFPAGIASGDYQVLFSAALADSDELAAYADTVLPVTVTEPEFAELDAVLQPGAPISGTVTADAGAAPLGDILVYVYDATLENLVSLTTTDADGSYTTDALPSGTYVVQFDPSSSSDEDVAGYTGEYNGNQLLESAAPTPLTVAAPTPLTGVDAALGRCPTCGQISGTVTAQDGGAPLGDVNVVVRNAADGSPVGSLTTDADGSYDLVVPSGSYTVEFVTDLSPSTVTQGYLDGFVGGVTPTAISVVAPAITANVNGVLAKGGQILGQVTAKDTQAGLAEVFIVISDASGTVVSTAFTDESGTYTTAALTAGAYTLSVQTADSANETTRAYKPATFRATVTGPNARVTGNIQLSR